MLLEKYYKTEEENPNLTNAEEIVFGILSDIMNRSGLQNSFEECDEEIQEEILQSWIDITNEKLDK